MECIEPIYLGSMPLWRLHVVNCGREVDLQGLSGASLQMVFNRPSGLGSPSLVNGTLTPATLPGKVDGEDGRYEYQTPDVNFIDAEGGWKLQGIVTLSGGQVIKTKIVEFEVLAPLPTS